MVCRNCSKEIEQGSKFCQYCGVSNSLCHNCNKELDIKDIFCKYCGAKNRAKSDIYTDPVDAVDHSNADDKVMEEPVNHKLNFIVGVVIIVIIGVAYYVGYNSSSNLDKPVKGNTPTSNTSNVSKTPKESEYKKKMRQLKERLKSNSSSVIAYRLPYPKTVLVTPDMDTFEINGAILTVSGHVEYVSDYSNNQNTKKTETFTISMIFAARDISDTLYLKIGNTVHYNDLKHVNKNGQIVTNIDYGGRGYGDYILDDIDNPDNWQKNAADYNNPEDEIRLEEYNSIKMGMSYDEVCEIVGSSGTKLARAQTAGYDSLIVAWNGIDVGASASISFQNNKVVATAQVGLQ